VFAAHARAVRNEHDDDALTSATALAPKSSFKAFRHSRVTVDTRP
jgi:hypothetical protein